MTKYISDVKNRLTFNQERSIISIMKLCISRQPMKHLPLNSGWSTSRNVFGYAQEIDRGGFEK